MVMKLYFAVGANWEAYKALRSVGGKRMLISFAYVPKAVLYGSEDFYEFYGKDIEPFIDSGAYTVEHVSGKKMSLKAYMKFLRKHDFPVYANLDKIASWEETLKNQKTMESEGLKPIPVYHMYEPIQVLKDYVGSYDYVALGFRSKSATDRARLATTVFEQFPDTKFHMFAITQPEIMINYPFYSVDSSTWLNSIKYGALLTPWGYILVGRENRGNSKRHIMNMSRTKRIKWETYFEGFGFKLIDLLGDDYRIRAAYSAKYFLTLETAINEHPSPKKGKKMLDAFFYRKWRIPEWLR